jgi:hypothetical protein
MFSPMYKEYLELEPHNERYEITSPSITAHNLIVGTPYFDLKGDGFIKNLDKPNEYCQLSFHERGWNKSNHFKVDGEIYAGNYELMYKIDAKWNQYAAIINVKTGEREVLWTKNPYPENWQYQYGMTQF